MIKGIIFDADGTILDTMPVWLSLGRRYLESIGIAADASLDKKLFGTTVSEAVGYIMKEYNITASEDEIISNILSMIEGFYKNNAEPKKGVVEYIRKINSEGIPAVIATAGDKKLLSLALDRLGIKECFLDILTCGELNTSKNSSYIFIEASRRLNATPGEIVVFDDSLHALKTAKKAGFITVAVEDDADKDYKDEIIEVSDYYIRDFTDSLLDCL